MENFAPSGTYVNTIVNLGNDVFAGTNKGVFHSTISGTSWSHTSFGLTDNGVLSLGVSLSHIYAGTTNGGVYQSTNKGTTWNQALNGLLCPYVTSFCIIGNNIFAGTCGGVFVSSNYGANWTQSNNELSNRMVSTLANLGNIVFAGTNDGDIYSTTDNGISWSLKNPSNFSFYNVTILKTYLNNIIAETYINTYISADSGNTWKSIPFVSGNTLFITGDDVYSGTNSGIYHSSISKLLDVKSDKQKLPVDYSLDQNYPNPFNPSTVIRYTLPVESNVKIVLYNSAGQKIRELINSIKPSGVHELNFNAGNLSTGIYFYTIIANSSDAKLNFRNTKKMLFIK